MPTTQQVANTGNRARLNSEQIEKLKRIIVNLPVPAEVKDSLLQRLQVGDPAVVQDIMSAAHGYPDTPLVFGPEVKFKLGVIAAIKRFKKKKTHLRTSYERLEAMRELARDLGMVYGARREVQVAAVCLVEDETADSRSSFYHRKTNTIVMVEKLSIITFLHEFAHALGKDEVGATRWSLTLFKRVWPDQFERLQPDGHTLIMPNGESEDNEPDVRSTTSPTVDAPAEPESEDEALGLFDDDENEEDEDDGEWIDEHFDDDDEPAEAEAEVAPRPPRRRRTKDKTAKPKAKPKAKAPATKPKRKPRKPKKRS